jgi:hypothetical protein
MKKFNFMPSSGAPIQTNGSILNVRLLFFTVVGCLISFCTIGQTISTGVVVGPFCAGSKLNVPYVYSGGALGSGNTFVAELSDANGSFASAVTIGTFATTTLTNWTVAATIPATIVQGTGYRVRVRSTNPAVIGSASSTDITLYEMYTGNQVFVESIGTASSSSVAVHESNNRFDNDGFAMSSTGGVTITNTSGSNGYTGASAGNNIRFSGTSGTFTIADINTTAYSQLGLGFGIMKNSASTNGSEITVAVSSDGVNYTNLTIPPLPTGGGTNNTWYYRVTSGTIPATANLRIRFTLNSSSTVTYNLDDFELGDAVSPATVAISPSTPQSVCNPGSVTLTATNVANANYLWSNSATTNSISVSSTGNYSVVASDLFGCAVSRGPVAVTVSNSFVPSVSVSTNTGTTICSGTAVQFTANPVNGGSSPSYQWKLNGANVGTNSATYSNSALNNGDVVSVVMTTSLACASSPTATSPNVNMTVNARPTASLSGSTDICEGSSSNIAIAVTGPGTISGTLSPGAIPFSGTAPTINVNLSPVSGATYTVATLSNANCSALAGDLTGSRTINVNARPTASISGSTTICNGTSTSIAISVIGTGTISGTLNPGAIAFSGTAPTINVNVSPTSNTTYTIASLSDNNCSAQAGDLTGSRTVNVNERPTGVLGGNQTICAGGTATLYVNVTGAGPFSGTLNPGAIPFSGAGPFITIDVTPAANTTYSLATLTDVNCSALPVDLSGTPTVIVHALPTVSISGTASVCEGSSSNITLTGTPDALVTYNINGGSDQTILLDGSGNAVISTGAVFNNLTYSLISVDDFVCQNSASGSAVITRTDVPEASISGSTSICSGSSAVISFVGTPSSTVTYSINGGPGINLALSAGGTGSFNTGVLTANTNYTLVSVSNGICSQNIGSNATITVTINTYYQDADGDGFGNPLMSVTGCAAPVGYVANNDDCCDADEDLNPLTEWWADFDGDGFGGFIANNGCLSGVGCGTGTWPVNCIPYFPGAHSGAAYVADCNDSNSGIHPSASELCSNSVDDDCDGAVNEGCVGPLNDNWSNAVLLNTSVAASIYPNSFNYNGNMLNATISSQGNAANVLPGGGRDVWYRFVAPSTAIQIKLLPNGFDGVLELQNASGTQLDVENINPATGGLEILNYASLTVGQTYYVAVRNYQNTNIGTFSLSASPLMPSGPAVAIPAAGFAMCANYQAMFRGANSYTFNFIGTGGAAPLTTTSVTNAGLINLSHPALGLRYGGVYNVRVDANYVLYNGLNVAEPAITVSGSVTSPNATGVNIMTQPLVEIRASQRCPVALNRNVYLNAIPVPGNGLVCGALNYTYEFTKVTDCTGATTLPQTFTVTTVNSSPFLILAAAFPSAQANTGYWNVRVRPNFAWGNGTFGPVRTIQVSGTSASMMLQEQQNLQEERMNMVESTSLLYPNPNAGDRFMLNLNGANDQPVMIHIYDNFGKLVYSEQLSVEGNPQREIVTGEKMTSGLYHVEIVMNGMKLVERMVVSNR